MESSLIILLLITSFMACKNDIDIFEEFIIGVKDAMNVFITILPSMMAFILWVTLAMNCGIVDVLSYLFKPLIIILKVPIEIFMLILLRPFSSSGAMSITNNIFMDYGIDHPYAILASIIQTGSDTTFYVVSLYFGSIHLKNQWYTLPIGLSLDLFASVMALVIYHILII